MPKPIAIPQAKISGKNFIKNFTPKHIRKSSTFFACQLLCIILAVCSARGEAIDLLQRYPTKLTAGDLDPDHARSWEFTTADIFRVTQFHLKVGTNLTVDVGPADVGIGHCADGAVWALLIPRNGGTVTRQKTNTEALAHIWLRFHPAEITRLFPSETVFADGATNLGAEMRFIANFKGPSSCQAGGRFMIPESKIILVDLDAKDGLRRFFVVNTEAQSAEYSDAFKNRAWKQPQPLSADLAISTFDKLWEAFDQRYAMFVFRPEVDWAKLREEYRPKALSSKTTFEFADTCADMLKNLRDLHVWLTLGNADVPVFNRPRFANANPEAYETILHGIKQQGSVTWAVTTNNIGFIAISDWEDSNVPADCGDTLEQMRNTRGLIIDVRLNGGGSEDLALQFANRFVEKDFAYAFNQFRNGPNHTNLTEQIARQIEPAGPWRYGRPVIVLIGQKCMSSNESFIGMMLGDPDVTTMGDHSCGSSGDPQIIQLPLDMTVSVPQWIDHRPDGTILDEVGFQPQIPFKAAPEAFQGNRDDLLASAVARLGQLPLPDKPIEGPVFDRSSAFLPDHSKGVEEEALDSARPKVISITPTNKSASASPVTELHIRFDRPMDPLSLKLDFEAGGFTDCEFPKYDPDKYEFIIPVHLTPGSIQQIVLNNPWGSNGELRERRKKFPLDGFQSSDHHLAGLFVWHFRTHALPKPPSNESPKMTSISPAPGSSVAILTYLEIQFDQPMASPSESCPFLVDTPGAEEIQLFPDEQYDPTKHTYRIPLLLPAKKNVEFSLTGFKNAAGIAAEPVKIHYKVSSEAVAEEDREETEAGVKDSRLLKLLKTMKKNREQIYSIAEHVQFLSLYQRNHVFVELKSAGASFKWQESGEFYADIGELMLARISDFRLGSNGQRCWWYEVSSGYSSTNMVICPVNEIQPLSTTICDPFNLTQMTPIAAAAKLRLKFAGFGTLGGRTCCQVEAWPIIESLEIPRFGPLTHWWIDSKTSRPAQIEAFDSGQVFRTRFLYDSVNKPLPIQDFAMPIQKELTATPPDSSNATNTNSFLNLSDGSDGNMKVNVGKKGSQKTFSEDFVMFGY